VSASSSSTHTAGVTVCVPSIRAGSVTAAIDSIRNQESQAWELIVVMQGDNVGLQREIAAAARADERIRTVHIPERSVSRARNAGAAASSSYPTIAFLDDDCEAAPDWLSRIERAFQQDPTVGIVAGSLVAPPRRGWRPARTPASHPSDFTLRPPQTGPLPPGAAFVTASCAIRRWAWEHIGTFDEELGAGTEFRGGEDLDLLLRAVAAEVPIRFLPEAVVHHTYGTRYGLRAVHDISVSYASGQGAVAAKLSLGGGGGEEWRHAVRKDCLVRPLQRLRPLGVTLRLPRLLAFERSYRRCLREFQLSTSGMLERRAVDETSSAGVDW
jgi:glycosyltransferase involved in cell wall biosynthesis